MTILLSIAYVNPCFQKEMKWHEPLSSKLLLNHLATKDLNPDTAAAMQPSTKFRKQLLKCRLRPAVNFHH